MARPSKRAKKTRTLNEFDLTRLVASLRPPVVASEAYAWTLEQIRGARDDQMRGRFKRPSQLAEAMRTDDALSVAYENRLAPQRCVGVELVPASTSDRARNVTGEADALFGQNGFAVSIPTLSTISGTLANHGVAFGYCTHTPRADGSRVDLEMHVWPIEWVEWDAQLRCFVTQVEQSRAAELEAEAYGSHTGLLRVPIVHGDGRWVVFKKHEYKPWTHEAALLPGALVWARHAFAARDWAKGSVAHGNAKVVAKMPEGFALADGDGAPTPETAALVGVLQELMLGDALVGVVPYGTEADFVTNTSSQWQVWHELMMNADKAAARIYLGTDGMLGSVGGAPGVDIATLFGVATTRVQGDLACIERALLTGVIEPWCAINFGDSTLAPRRRYQMPDADFDALRSAAATRWKAFTENVRALRDAGFDVTQDLVGKLAAEHGVEAPTLRVATTAPAAAPTNGAPRPQQQPANGTPS